MKIWRIALTLIVSGFTAFCHADDFIKGVAHADVEGKTPLELYRITELGSEVEALSEPDQQRSFEYWPFVFNETTKTQPYPYPDDVLWGFQAGGDMARECAKLSWHILQYIQKDPPEELVALLQHEYAPDRYFHWINDFTRARTYEYKNSRGGPGYRSFWHYSPPNGMFKWISNVLFDGRCQHPTVEAVTLYADCELKQLQKAPDQCPGHFNP